MKINKDNFYEIIEKYFTKLPNKISHISQSDFENMYNSELSKKSKNIVYFWQCEKPIPRVNGSSNIMYIGQTKQSFKNRYFQYAKKQATTKANKLKYQTILKTYGSITISICDFSIFGDTLLKAEGQLLWWYFQNHCEYPPLNYTKTKIRNDEFEIQI
jgi:hypothetical protein